mgnify:CR=1
MHNTVTKMIEEKIEGFGEISNMVTKILLNSSVHFINSSSISKILEFVAYPIDSWQRWDI